MNTLIKKGTPCNKVDTFKENALLLNKKVEVLNEAYQSRDFIKIDKAIADLNTHMDSFLPKDGDVQMKFRNHIWQSNNILIMTAIRNFISEFGRMPSTNQISIDSGLSNETIYKHLRDMKDSVAYKETHSKFEAMKEDVLVMLYKLAAAGDVRACKVFIEYFPARVIEQTNYIQINNLKITPEELMQLPPATKKKIEALIKTPVHRKTVNIK